MKQYHLTSPIIAAFVNAIDGMAPPPVVLGADWHSAARAAMRIPGTDYERSRAAVVRSWLIDAVLPAAQIGAETARIGAEWRAIRNGADAAAAERAALESGAAAIWDAPANGAPTARMRAASCAASAAGSAFRACAQASSGSAQTATDAVLAAVLAAAMPGVSPAAFWRKVDPAACLRRIAAAQD